jgi:hypothetical protein
MKKPKLLIVIGGAVLLLVGLVVGAVFIVPMIASANAAQTQISVTPTPTQPTATAGKNAVFQQFLKKYRSDIYSEIAQGLHLTPQQLQADMKSGQSLSDIATAQHVSSTDLRTIATKAIKDALNKAVSAGDLTQQQANQFATRLDKNPKFLDRILSAKHNAKQQSGTPTATPTP